jgi:hypothetical protein
MRQWPICLFWALQETVVRKKLLFAGLIALLLGFGLCPSIAFLSMTTPAHADNNP